MAENACASFWATVYNVLQARGQENILIAVTDGLKAMTQALETACPKTEPQTCIVYLIRASIAFISQRDHKSVRNALKPFYQAVDAEQAERALQAFEISELG